MKTVIPARLRTAALLFPPAIAILAAAGDPAARKSDPLVAEIARCKEFVSRHPASGEDWGQIKQVTEPALASAEKAFHRGHRWLALHRLGAARAYLAASAYAETRRPAKGTEASAVEAEWKRLGDVLRQDLEPVASAKFAGIAPAALRAIAEAALPQVRAYYESSLEYGRATMPKYGFLYLGMAQAQRDFARFCRTLSVASGRRMPPVRSLAAELDALEAELLTAYRPPASIEKHSDFIAASDALKEARELDAAGLRYGALARYLLAVQRLEPLRPLPRPPIASEILERRLSGWEARLSQGDIDHSIGHLYLEAAFADLADTAPGANPVFAAAIVEDVLPRYLAALEPARPATPKPAPLATVTLVRWPYT
jgi:hypothetical protein